MKNLKKIGLALSSGGFRGFALIGVLQALKENNIPIDFISGTSIGSLVAAHYAIFQNVDLLKKDIVNNPDNKMISVFDLGFRGGLVKGDKFKNFVESIFSKRTFAETKIPLLVVATNLASGQAHIFREGKIAISIQASCTVPVLFEPVKIKGHSFVDGGLSDPVPVGILKKLGAEAVIAINLYHKNEFIDKRFTLAKVALRSTRIAMYNLAQASIKTADVVVSPDTSLLIQTNDFRKYLNAEVIEKMIVIGYKETIKCLPAIKKILE